jgi:predicted transcriptional regulator
MEITISIPDELVSAAQSSGLPAEAYVELLLGRIAAASVARNRDREHLRAELDADWEQYQSTGLHLDEDEVDGWLAQIESGENVDPPALHV